MDTPNNEGINAKWWNELKQTDNNRRIIKFDGVLKIEKRPTT